MYLRGDHTADALRYGVEAYKKMEQSKKESLNEALTNTAVGFIGSLLITLVCNYLLPQRVGIAAASVIIVGLCTLWSIFRGYQIRRYFEGRRKRKSQLGDGEEHW